ncbi:MAG TPA: CapA family protein [bacterium]|nr:CapA family protein [bacterium]
MSKPATEPRANKGHALTLTAASICCLYCLSCLSDISSHTAPTAQISALPSVIDRAFSVLACGDILLARTPGKRASERGYRFLFSGVKDMVSAADIAFANLESPASYIGTPYPGKPENITFRADPATLFGVAWAGFDVLSMANNHMTDFGPKALAETLDFIDLLGMSRCGAGIDAEDARAPAVIEREGVRFVFLAYAEPIWSVVAAKSAIAARAYARVEARLSRSQSPKVSTAAVDASRAGIAPIDTSSILADIRRAKATLAPDYLFVSLHWGEELEHMPSGSQRTLGRAIIDAGATAVLGHHPHVLQSVERYRDGLIIYSLGNFVFDMASSVTYDSAAVRIIVAGGRIDHADILPLSIERTTYRPVPASVTEAARRLADMQRWSASTNTTILIQGTAGRLFF